VLAGVRDPAKAPAGTEPRRLDVTSAEDVTALDEVGELDALVNNAGIAIASPVETLPLDELRRQLEVNLIGQVAITQALLPALRASRGRIVFVGSIAGRSALPFLSAYAASKHALEAVADSLRVELAPWGIAVSVVQPGTIRTPMWQTAAAYADGLAEQAGDRLGIYAERTAAFRAIAAKRGANGAPAERVAAIVERAITADRPRTRYVVGRDAHIRATIERLPDRLRDRVYERLLLRS
jgi:NAD(P)-dependent dehydrogenase (short-subunit alcohol dehydrogenase family)